MEAVRHVASQAAALTARLPSSQFKVLQADEFLTPIFAVYGPSRLAERCIGVPMSKRLEGSVPL